MNESESDSDISSRTTGRNKVPAANRGASSSSNADPNDYTHNRITAYVLDVPKILFSAWKEGFFYLPERRFLIICKNAGCSLLKGDSVERIFVQLNAFNPDFAKRTIRSLITSEGNVIEPPHIEVEEEESVAMDDERDDDSVGFSDAQEEEKEGNKGDGVNHLYFAPVAATVSAAAAAVAAVDESSSSRKRKASGTAAEVHVKQQMVTRGRDEADETERETPPTPLTAPSSTAGGSSSSSSAAAITAAPTADVITSALAVVHSIRRALDEATQVLALLRQQS